MSSLLMGNGCSHCSSSCDIRHNNGRTWAVSFVVIKFTWIDEIGVVLFMKAIVVLSSPLSLYASVTSLEQKNAGFFDWQRSKSFIAFFTFKLHKAHPFPTLLSHFFVIYH